MLYHSATTARFGGVLTAGALAVAAIAGLGYAPTANATCASILGIGNSANCTSNFTSIAIAIGTNASAHADDILGAAYAIGKDASAQMAGGDIFNLAVALGDNALAVAGGSLGTSVALGRNGQSQAGYAGQLGNVAVNIGEHAPQTSVALAAGFVNLAVNAFGDGLAFAEGNGNVGVNSFGTGTHAFAIGNFNNSTNIFGQNNGVSATGKNATANWAFNVLGSNNKVSAGPGPLAVAGAILKKNADIAKVGPGININGFKIGGAATSRGTVIPAAATAAPAAATAAPSVKPVATVPSAPRAAATTRMSTRVAK